VQNRVIAVVFEFDSEWLRGAVTAVVALAVLAVAWILGRGASRAFENPQQSYNARRMIRSAAWIGLLVGDRTLTR